jgi:nucleolar protein 16
MSIAEQKILQSLIAKHDDDYAAMFRDRQLNPMQETEAVLKKRVALYKRLQAL